jgi:hypothetical protein
MRIDGKNISGNISGNISDKRPPRHSPKAHAPCAPGAQRLFPGRLAFRRP